MQYFIKSSNKCRSLFVVDGYLKDWSEWSTCSQTCGSGFKTRSRVCVPPRNGGAPCGRNNPEKNQCMVKHCPVDGYFENWSNWTSCSQTCGSGSMTRSRTCVPPQNGGAPCRHNNVEKQECLLKHCPGLACPECDANLKCVRNRTCSPGEACMINNSPFYLTCFKTHDCNLLKNTTEILCCEDDQCVNDIIS